MSFLGQLADQVSSQFSLGENSNTSLNAVINGQNVPYGALGDFAQQIDQSAERRYVDEGYLRRDPYTTNPRQFETLFQEPNATIIIKKRMFSSVAENFRPDFMDADETLYFKATKVLFQNKCRQIAALEKLSKIQKVSAAVGSLNDQLVPIIITLADSLPGSNGNLLGTFGSSNPFNSSDVSQFMQTVDQLRKLYAFSHSNQYTTWITDNTNLFRSQFGQGTGAIEITNFTNFNTTTTINLNQGGQFGFTVADPYKATLITEYDIELAISDATNAFYNSKTYQLGLQSADQVINDNQTALNNMRARRGASNISFVTDPNTLLGKRLTAIIDSLGLSIPFTYNSGGSTGFPGLGGFTGDGVVVPPEYLEGGTVAGFAGLGTTPTGTLGANPTIKAFSPQTELSLFQALVTAIFNKLSLQANAQNAFQTGNKNTNYARRKMRSNFSGQYIVQPMDTVHIYINSKSRYDSKLLTGINNMFTGAGILQNLNNSLVGVTDAFGNASALFNESGGLSVQAEKSIYVGPNFPNYLWSLLRTQFVTEQEGTHVFGGVVERAIDNWTDGKYTLDVSGKDNTYYFEQGKVNFTPGADAFNGAIFDPLTPFKSNFDTISSNTTTQTPELLDENKFLLTTSQDSSLVKFKLGPFAGQKATQYNFIQDHTIDQTTKVVGKVFYAPDGLVYKWKEGIGVFTYGGNSLAMNDPNKVGAPNLYKEPFAGQDVMNVLSLLITGIPYNFDTYFKTSQNFGGASNDPQSLQSSAYNFINSLQTGLAKNNALWGHFVPFKNLVLGEQAYSKSITGQFSAARQNDTLNAQVKQLADLSNKMILAGASNVLAAQSETNNPDFKEIQTAVHNLVSTINTTVQSFDIQNASSLIGSTDVSYGNLNSIDPGGKNKSLSDSSLRKYLRRQINFLTRRMSYDVRGNTDKNLFIVDDTYDKDYDIAAYNQALADGIKLYNNDFTSVKQKIGNVAQLLDLEVFCDSQGHIRVRPPQYNRMPSSVFYRMMYLKQTLNVQVFPQFMADFFLNQLDTLKSRVEILEDQIRLDCALLGQYSDLSSDGQATAFLQNSSVTENTASSFSFLSISTSGVIVDTDILLKQANPDQINAGATSNNSFSNLQNQSSSTKNVFTNSQRYVTLASVLSSQASKASGYNVGSISAAQSSQVVNTLISRINTKSGQHLSVQDYIVSNDAGIKGVAVPSGQAIDVFKVTQELTDLTTQRQKVIKLFYQTLKNAAEFTSLDSTNAGQTTNALMVPGAFGNDNIPEVYEHMIEDEGYDDYGPGSGSRYIIKEVQVRSVQVGITSPEHTAVEVKGVLNPFAPNALPTGLNAFPNDGNGLTTAMAVDYDMWRSYGYKEPAVIDVPFLSDPVSQCGPYAAMLLSRNRKNLIRGTMTISGNEFMQPGEVIYYEDRNMLFYVNSVRHQFTYASGFTTTLELSYGHTPGEYIPTVMDIIGKLIYSNKDIAALTVQRQESSSNDINLGALIADANSNNPDPINTGDPNVATSSLSNFNSQVISNILYTAAFMVNSNNSQGNNIVVKVDLRCYYDDATGSVDAQLASFRNAINVALVGGSNTGGPITPQSVSKGGGAGNPGLPATSINIVDINIDDETDRRSPSQKAMDSARRQTKEVASGISSDSTNLDGDQIRKALFGYIVDCWLSIQPVAPQNSGGS